MTAARQQQLFDEIDILPIDIKTKIVENILNSINPVNGSIDDLWILEANKRKAEIESASVKLVDGDDVFRKIAQRFKIGVGYWE